MSVKGYAFFETTRDKAASAAAQIRETVKAYPSEIITTVAGRYEYLILVLVVHDDPEALEELFSRIRTTITLMNSFTCVTSDTPES